MGLRGVHAKPTGAPEKRRRRKPWQKKGLSRAERVIAFIETLQITSGMRAGERFRLREWQRDIIRAVYSVDAAGHRYVRQVLLTMPRKNGKTALSAALVLVHLVGPESERRGQIYSAAADRKQAALIFDECEAMILADPDLAARVNVQRFHKRLEDTETRSVYAALSADAKTAHGLSASVVIYDELAQAPDRKLFDVLTTSSAARAEPLAVVISTQSSDPHHVMSELVDYGESVRDGIVSDPSFLPFIFSAPPDADPWCEDTWHACNPALGDFRSLDEMRATAARAQRMPALEAVFRALYLNQRVEPETRFIAASEWDACSAAPDLERLKGRPCFGGLDLGSTRDLTALLLVFPDDAGGLDVLAHFWCPRDTLQQRADTDKVPYPSWVESGFIEATPGRSTDSAFIVHRIGELAADYDIQVIAYDRWRIEDLKRSLADEGIEVRLEPYGQGFRDMGPAVDVLERAILERKIRHGAHPVLTWNASNAVIVKDPAGNRKLDKEKSREKIDGIVALAMALGILTRWEPVRAPLCAERGLLELSL